MLSDNQLEKLLHTIRKSDGNRFERRSAADKIEKHIKGLTNAKDSAYKERNLLVAALSKVFPAHLALHPDEDTEWEDDWRTIVFIEIPVGKGKTTQVSWHIHESEKSLFKHLPEGRNDWDGHDTKEKYNRLRRVKANESK